MAPLAPLAAAANPELLGRTSAGWMKPWGAAGARRTSAGAGCARTFGAAVWDLKMSENIQTFCKLYGFLK